MSDFETEKVGEFGRCDIIRYDCERIYFTEYHCRDCRKQFGNRLQAQLHKCEGNENAG